MNKRSRLGRKEKEFRNCYTSATAYTKDSIFDSRLSDGNDELLWKNDNNLNLIIWVQKSDLYEF